MIVKHMTADFTQPVDGK